MELTVYVELSTRVLVRAWLARQLIRLVGWVLNADVRIKDTSDPLSDWEFEAWPAEDGQSFLASGTIGALSVVGHPGRTHEQALENARGAVLDMYYRGYDDA
ncbi:MAG: hypothetical protein ACOC9X_01375 [bacterium]